MTIPFLPTPDNWPYSPLETLWLTALLGGFLILSNFRIPP
ncbi:hypothetical protein SAMN05661093_09901 [Kibdelosporangium aridum]|uniref:Uncharacterized protein n=1 Tax=Kibdelosporangium aridum TaxID=2030 RepID=A0A1Y5Y662_KIBAR|nr:hypothetical protein SAMN05661093_09901 [Kibdelosporangium aridum]